MVTCELRKTKRGKHLGRNNVIGRFPPVGNAFMLLIPSLEVGWCLSIVQQRICLPIEMLQTALRHWHGNNVKDRRRLRPCQARVHSNQRGTQHDYWWTETFDAAVVASGHYHVPLIPNVPGLIETSNALPGRFEHSKSYRKPNKFAGKRVLVVGGSISAVDFIHDLHGIVDGKLEVTILDRNSALESAHNPPNVNQHPTVNKFIKGVDKKVVATFSDGSSVSNIDAVKAALSSRIYEYQAVAVARYYAGRNATALPSEKEQRQWEADTLKLKGASSNFHEITPDLGPYYNWIAHFAGKPAQGREAYELSQWQEVWGQHGFSILDLKGKYWQSIIDKHKAGSGLSD
ncbi:hypothetical protein SEUCBS139899_002099 [Sporothrix eucalyptigena]